MLRLVPTSIILFQMLCFDAIPDSVRALLVRLAPHTALADFSLGGGTSLALRFGHRLSVDLDFFTLQEFSPELIFKDLQLVDATITGRAINSLTADVGGVKLDLLRHSYPSLAPNDKLDGITLVSLPDLAAMKLNALTNRGSKKDFFDFAELLNHLAIGQMLDFFTNKYQAMDVFTVIRSLAWFEDAELEPDPISLTGLTWSQVKAKARVVVAGL